MAIVETFALSRWFGGVRAVDGLSITVDACEVFGLLGPNGAGKSTTVKMLTTLLRPSAGRATIDGYDLVRQASSVRRVIGYVPQLVSADGSLTGAENLRIFAKLYDIPHTEQRARIDEALEFMGLTNAAHAVVGTYSGGMIRRLEIAQSMLHRPRVLFLDEPTVGLDPSARKAVWEHLRSLREEFDTTIVMTTHQMEEADGVCSRVAILHQGQVAVIGTPAELKASLGAEGATLDDVFIKYAGTSLESGGYREARRTRRTARRLG